MFNGSHLNKLKSKDVSERRQKVGGKEREREREREREGGGGRIREREREREGE